MSQYETQSVHKQDTIIYIQLLYNMACWLLYIMQDCTLSLNGLILIGRDLLLPVVFQEPWQAVVNPKNKR